MKNFLFSLLFAVAVLNISADQMQSQEQLPQASTSVVVDQAKQAYEKALIEEKTALENFNQARGLDKKNAQELLAVAKNTTMLTKQAFDRARAKASNQ